MKGEDMAEELLNLAGKADNVIEDQDEFITAHILGIKQHSKLIEREKEMCWKAQ